jgi:hypothetical protein
MVMTRMKDAERAIMPDFSITWRKEDRKGYTVQPSAPRVLRIRRKKEAA